MNQRKMKDREPWTKGLGQKRKVADVVAPSLIMKQQATDQPHSFYA